MKTLAALASLCAAPAFAECPDDMALLFGCSIVERNAQIEMCRGDGQIRYTYAVDGEPELQFTGPAWGGVKALVQGIHGAAYASAARTGDSFYAVWVDGAMMALDGEGQDLGSPNPAVLQVYGSEADFTAYRADAPIARRVCYPPSIQFDRSNFGPG